MRERQGKCRRCRVRWVWTKTMPLKRAYCPDCGSKLEQTTHMMKRYPTIPCPLPADVWEARRLQNRR